MQNSSGALSKIFIWALGYFSGHFLGKEGWLLGVVARGRTGDFSALIHS